MIEHYNVLQKLKKDKFLMKFYKKHVDLVEYKKRFKYIMEAFSVAFKLSSDIVLKEEIKTSKFKLNTTNGLITRDEMAHSQKFDMLNITPYSQILNFEVEENKNEKEKYWVLGQPNLLFSRDTFYFTLKDRTIFIDVYDSEIILNDKDINKYIVEKKDESNSLIDRFNCKIEARNLNDLEEILGRILILVAKNEKTL